MVLEVIILRLRKIYTYRGDATLGKDENSAVECGDDNQELTERKRKEVLHIFLNDRFFGSCSKDTINNEDVEELELFNKDAPSSIGNSNS